MKVACSWSSGKDSCLSLFKAQQQGYKVDYLFNFISEEYRRVTFHGAKAELVKLQADSLGVELVQKTTNERNYEEVFRNTLSELKSYGVGQIIRGDIYLQDLKDWVQNMCQAQDLGVISPIWHQDTKSVLNELVDFGFKAIVTSAQAKKLQKDWIGRVIDKQFIADIEKISDVDICGEMGEFHSFVFDGPNFKNRIEITKTDKLFIKEYWFLDIQEYKIIEKEQRV
ncbi:MAG: diphthine--ammonia ligase [Candidatus Omnitrophota bacterium]|jgi:uncharacterized protein (TIGR00290 family)|nr:MAG: diphthine--ammonia ligase [Candidatus Omnitrophota bacterium]